MLIRRIIGISIILLFCISCSSSYKYLSNNSLDAPDDFSKYLLENYKNKAKFEADKMHDWNSAKLYSEKALKAFKGVNLKPQDISYWKVSKEERQLLLKAYDNLIKVYKTAVDNYPYDLAIAIVSLDCWAEQLEEGWQIDHIDKCKNEYLTSMHNIYNSINNEEKEKSNESITKKNNDSVIVVKKHKTKKVKEIIYFDFDKTKINNISLEKIKEFFYKNEDEIIKYLIVGHTDTKGTNEYNFNLSLKRAIAVQKKLIELGVDKSDIKILAKGELDLAIETADEIAHPANRRVEISPIN